MSPISTSEKQDAKAPGKVATLATYFVGRDAESSEAELAGAKELAELRNELSALRCEIRALSGRAPEL